MKSMELIAVGERFRTARKSKRIRQKEMAKALGVSSNFISDIENGKANPGVEFFLKLNSVYKISIEYLFHGKGSVDGGEEDKAADGAAVIDGEIDTVEKLVSLMEKSNFIKNTMLNFATQFVLENEKLVKKILSKSKKNEEINDE